MTRQEILEKAIAEVYDCAPDLEGKELTEDTVINTDTGIDSMGLTLIICRLEAVFDVKIPHRQWQEIQTLGDVVDAFEKRLK
ncbi:MAG: hypothetical protein E7514_01120 [Ruminococcaceae bacterium]|nr:hypothetical protein [Oscillospiraceae bacterium]